MLDTHTQGIDLLPPKVLACLLCFVTFTPTTYNLFPEECVFSMLITFSCTVQYSADSMKQSVTLNTPKLNRLDGREELTFIPDKAEVLLGRKKLDTGI